MDWTERAADAVLADLQGRKGVGDMLDEIEGDTEVWQELRETLADIIATEFGRIDPLPEPAS